VRREDRLTWGLLGASHIAKTQVGPAFQRSQFVALRAVASRDLRRARALAQSLQAPRAYGSYLELLEDPEIDAVYISLTNAQHHRWVLSALQHGKHVLCEKPLALSLEEAEEMATVAASQGRYLMEAFMYRFHPRIQRAWTLAHNGDLGRIQYARVRFTYRLSDQFDDSNYRASVAGGGGVLYDVGCYCVDALSWFLGGDVRGVSSWLDFGPTGVDARASALLEFENRAIGQLFCSMDTPGGGDLEVLGDDALLTIPMAFGSPPDAPPPSLQIRTPTGVVTEPFDHTDPYVAEVEAFSRAVRNGAPCPIDLADAVRNAALLDAIRRASGIRWNAVRGIPALT
jgi:xylose dehydrogenase (NAD/NADP)